MSRVISDTLDMRMDDAQPNLWGVGSGAARITSLAAALHNQTNGRNTTSQPFGYFTSAHPVGTQTGVMRNFALRMNTSVSCKLLSSSSMFPKSCAGDASFYRNFSNAKDSDSLAHSTQPYINFAGRVCAPGDMTKSPWNQTGDPQELYEDLWLDYQISGRVPSNGSDIDLDKQYDFTQHCNSLTTLGYFELPNYWNGNTVGPLIANLSADYEGFRWLRAPRVMSTYKPAAVGNGFPGPLLAASVALFGKNTFFDLVSRTANQYNTTSTPASATLISSLRYPFANMLDGAQSFPPLIKGAAWEDSALPMTCHTPTSSTDCTDLLSALLRWFRRFGDEASATAALTLTTLSAAKNVLTLAHGSSPVDTSEGTELQKPVISTPAMVVITILLVVQLSGLGSLALYSCWRPSWTATLDAMAVLRIGAELRRMGEDEDEIYTTRGSLMLDTASKKVKALLIETDGWVGSSDSEGMASEAIESQQEGQSAEANERRMKSQRLALGGILPVGSKPIKSAEV